MKLIADKISYFFHTEPVLCISGTLALLSMFFNPPGKIYFSYIDFRVLCLLFCLMAVIAGFQKLGLFLVLSERLLYKVKTTRQLFLLLVILCFFSSMWITNDVALITFVPFTIMILSRSNQGRYMIFLIVIETIAANLGSMLTPVGNPQNLYLYSYYRIPIGRFLQITLPITLVSLFLLCMLTFIIKPAPLVMDHGKSSGVHLQLTSRLWLYLILFLICMGCVLRLMDYRLMFILVLLLLLLFEKRIFREVDYYLLLTFVFFFLFIGNIGSIPQIRNYLVPLIQGNELITSLVLSQVISNVPAAVLLSSFTDNYKALIIGTDLGGLGTLVASLASLISYKFYCKLENAKPGKYLGVFTLYNSIFLFILCMATLRFI